MDRKPLGSWGYQEAVPGPDQGYSRGLRLHCSGVSPPTTDMFLQRSFLLARIWLHGFPIVTMCQVLG